MHPPHPPKIVERMIAEAEEGKEDKENNAGSSSWPNRNGRSRQEEEGMRAWGILLFGLIGATATTFAVGQLRRIFHEFYTQLTKLQSSRGGATGGSYHSSFKEEARRRYNRRIQEECEEEMERVARIRRMQNAFNRERNKYKRSYENWRENGPGAYHEHFQRDDWYWKDDTFHRDQNANSRETPINIGSCSLSYHYSVLGLDRWRAKPYTESEIKTAFRAKAKEYHPDQNQDNKEAAEEKFKEVMTSYETIKLERKNEKS